MATPYWGQLPGPKIVKNRRMSDDDAKSPLDAQLGAPNLAHSPELNRVSVQTAQTAITGTTFSPLVSPANSTFTPQGLAPRPPSYQRPRAAAPESEPGPSTRISGRRQSRKAAEPENDYPTSPNLPIAPESTRGPPVRYRHPYGNGDLPYTHTEPGPEKPPRPTGAPDHHHGKEMEYVEQYTAHRGGPFRGYGDAGTSGPSAAMDPSRRASVGMSERRRKSAAMAKSPLQRLELTLDSMTKEEKRARVEAAERRARERAAQRADQVPFAQQAPFVQQVAIAQQAPVSQQAPVAQQAPAAHKIPVAQVPAYHPGPSRNRRASVSLADPRPVLAPPAALISREPPMPRTMPVTPDLPREYVPVSRAMPVTPDLPREYVPVRRHTQVDHRTYQAPAPRAREPVHMAPQPDPAADLPRRNLSFRERTTREEMNIPDNDEGVRDERGQEPRETAPNGSGAFSLIRSVSNKLKKIPPTASSSHEPVREAESTPPVPRRDSLAMEGPPHEALPQWVRDKELLVEPNTRRPSAVANARGVPEHEIHGIQRRATEPMNGKQYHLDGYYAPPAQQPRTFKQETNIQQPIAPQNGAAQQRRLERQDSNESSEGSHHHHISDMLYRGKEGMTPGDGLYNPPQWLDEWKKASTGVLTGSLLSMSKERLSSTDQVNQAWWEGGTRRSSYSSRPARSETLDGEYADLHGPTRFKPQLYLECGPLLRYCGMRHVRVPKRYRGADAEMELWRGSIMIVTRDVDSTYEIPPMLRLFVQDLELLPAPPHQVNGELSPEYVDPIAGHPKLGRRGETLFVRPVEHLEEGKDLSRDKTDNGLFEARRSTPDVPPADGSPDYPGTFASRMKRAEVDGEKLQKYRDVTGFRLHAEHGRTFWRFNIEIELRDRQQRIAYRINRGPCNAFWVPARGTPMNVMFHSCNGFSIGAKTDVLSGPDPMWRDVLNNHQTSPFHVMIGGGDQIYNDDVADECNLFIDWLETNNPLHKRNAPFTPEFQAQVEDFYFKRYCTWFSQGLFGLANSQIPMVNMWSDRESFNGFGSYPHRDMDSPVLSGVGSVAFKYYMLFQHQSIMPETEDTEPSWVIGAEPGPYVNEQSRSVYVSLGSKLALLAADCRTERTEDNVIDDKTWERIMNRLYAEVKRGQVEHLLVVLPVPIAYPRLAWLENLLTSRAMNPIKALGKRGLLGKALHNIDGGSEVMDDLKDHWTAKNHKTERTIVIEDLQDLAIDKSLRVTILSGDVNMAAVGQFYSNPKLGLAKHKDPRYIPNIISSAIANAPPPDIMADALNKRHKVHHFDDQTDESMIPMFQHGVDGKPRNNKRLLPHRNWCSIRQWVPGSTPPPTPPLQAQDRSMSVSPPTNGNGSGLLRRFSLSGSSHRPDMSRESVRGSRPPVAGGGSGLFRSLSRGLSRRKSTEGERPAKLTRTLSLGGGGGGSGGVGGGGSEKRGFFIFGRRNSKGRPDDGGINGQWGTESEDEYDAYPQPREPGGPHAVGLRGGAAQDEYSDGDDMHFTAAPPRRAQTLGSQTLGSQSWRGDDDIPPQALKPFHRTPTGLSTKQMRKAEEHEIDLEGGLDICLNVEVNPKDPAGITVPYRLLVPRLFYEYTPEVDKLPLPQPSGFKRLLSFRKKEKTPPPMAGLEEDEEEEDEDRDEREQQYHQHKQQVYG
ncbi:hypothetical protein ACO1O0_004008 [Amphichorda felina]